MCLFQILSNSFTRPFANLTWLAVISEKLAGKRGTKDRKQQKLCSSVYGLRFVDRANLHVRR